MERVIGLGGPFIKAKDPKALVAWYEKHLGLNFNGSVYTSWPFAPEDGSPKAGYNVFSFFKEDSDYFASSRKDVMVNFIVKDLFGLMEKLKEEGVTLVVSLWTRNTANSNGCWIRKGISSSCGSLRKDEKKFAQNLHTLIFALL